MMYFTRQQLVILVAFSVILNECCNGFSVRSSFYNNNDNNQYIQFISKIEKSSSSLSSITKRRRINKQPKQNHAITTLRTSNTLSLNLNKDDNEDIMMSSSSLSLKAASIEIPLPDNSAPWDDVSFRFGSSSTKSISSSADPKVGVLLLNLGGPETSDDVEGFLYNLFADPDIIRLPGPLAPLQKFIAYFISKRRAPKSRQAYASIGGGSPILKYSKEQANLMQQSILERYGIPVKTYIGMRYWYPFTEEALEDIRKDKIDALVIVPLYPQFSISTSGSSLRILQEEFSKNSDMYKGMVHTVVPSWYARPGYIKAMADLIETELESYNDDEKREALSVNGSQKPLHILFSAHGVPQSYIDVGDPYQKQIIECVDMIKDELLQRHNYQSDVDIHLSYQSRVGPIEWLRPYTDDVIPELGQSGVKNLVVVPISFVSEHVETLEEIDIEYRELAEENGVSNWRRVPALNTDPAFIEDMADLIMDALAEPAQSITEACVANSVRDVELQPLDERLGIESVSVLGVAGYGSTLSIGTNGQQQTDQNQQETERWTGRIALFAVVGILVAELISGQSMVNIMSIFASS